jgi:hypothetical protein
MGLDCHGERRVTPASRASLRSHTVRSGQSGKHWEVLHVERHQGQTARLGGRCDQCVDRVRSMAWPIPPDVIASEACDIAIDVMNGIVREQSIDLPALPDVSASSDKFGYRHDRKRGRILKARHKIKSRSLSTQHIDYDARVQQHHHRPYTAGKRLLNEARISSLIASRSFRSRQSPAAARVASRQSVVRRDAPSSRRSTPWRTRSD